MVQLLQDSLPSVEELRLWSGKEKKKAETYEKNNHKIEL